MGLPDRTEKKNLTDETNLNKKKSHIMGLCVSFCALPYSHSPPLISLFLHLSWWVLSESCQGICVCPPSSPHYSPWGGACASLTSESLPQRCSDVLCCLLKNLPGDCCHRGRCPIIPCVLPPVMMDHSQDAGLQSAVLRARGVRKTGVKEIWMAAGEGVMIVRHLHKHNSPLGHE